VGPENYYFIANAYYNPAIYQYDPSWFDKPHNYLIEVLVTTGVFGFAAYAAMLIACVWILALAYRRGLLSLLEFCLLLAGFLTYDSQNLFVFDTISASLMFFVFLGFVGFLWQEIKLDDKSENNKKNSGLDPVFVNTATVLCALGAMYFIYIGNITGIVVAKNINYGYAYANVDPQIAQNYFQAVKNSPFDFDPVQFASKYADSAIHLASNPGTQTPAFVNQSLQEAISAGKDAVLAVPSDPTAWEGLANLYLTESIVQKTAIDPAGIAAAEEAIKLAPGRPEPIMMMTRVDIFRNNYSEAESLLKNLINSIPQDNEAKLQLAMMYAYQGQMDKALAVGQALIDSGYIPGQASEIDWMGQAYDKQGNFAAAAQVYEFVVKKVDPNNLQDQWALAQDYAKLGQKDKAIAIAKSLITADPTDASHFQDFINSMLQK
jgi:tetratricopeptide (TPR) repeat protein